MGAKAKVKKYKLKTISSAKKRFKITSKGRIKITQAGKQHNMRKRSNKMIRNARGFTTLDSTHEKHVKRNLMPNG